MNKHNYSAVGKCLQCEKYFPLTVTVKDGEETVDIGPAEKFLDSPQNSPEKEFICDECKCPN